MENPPHFAVRAKYSRFVHTVRRPAFAMQINPKECKTHINAMFYIDLQYFLHNNPFIDLVKYIKVCDNIFFGAKSAHRVERWLIPMRILHAPTVVDVVRRLCLRACCDLPQDVQSALAAAQNAEAEGSAARSVLSQLLENQNLARTCRRPICQDTGMAVVFADIGRDVFIDGDLEAAVNEGVRLAYTDGYLRKSVLDPITRVNTQDNTPAVLHVRFVPGDRLTLTVAPKGFGSENMSRLFMLSPSAGVEGVVDSIVTTVLDAGASACPPGVVGVGIGGTMEQAALLAKRQLLRPLGVSAERDDLANIEREALRRINESGLGPMGLGGKTTALAVHVGALPTHIAALPVAVNLQCHACRHASEEV